MYETKQPDEITAEDIKSQVKFTDLIARYGYKVDRHKMLCPFHYEKTGSFHVYETTGKCYGGCGWFGDIIQFVMDKESVYFPEALRLLSEWFGLIKGQPKKEVQKVNSVPKKVHRDPVSLEIVDYFHQQLTKERRQWLYEKRLLTDESINYYQIGWRPDMEAYSIPFWKGVPRMSAVDTMQFRYTPKEGRDARYIGLDGYTFPSVIGRHTINPDFLVVFVGTFDCLLANQDGIPAISPNGLTVWKNRLDELKWIVGNVSQLFFVPDNTTSETIESVRLANALGAKLKYLPQMENGKDYTDYRLNGFTGTDFIEQVLGMDKKLFIENSAHAQTVEDILSYVAAGEADKALELLEILQLNEYAGWSVSHKLMCIASEQPESMTPKQWQSLIQKLEFARTYESIGQAFKDTITEVNLSRGDF